MTSFRLLFSLSLILFISRISLASYSPADLVNPNIADRTQYVADPAGLVGASALQKANSRLWHLRQATGVEVVIAVVPDTGDLSEEEFATELFSRWGVGKRDKDNGVLVLIVPDQRSARIATGYGVEGVIPDIAAMKIIQRSIAPYMKNNDLDGAVDAVSSDLAEVLSNPEAAEELRSSNKEAWQEMPESDITGEDIIAFALIIAILLFAISIIKYIYDSRRFGRQDRYRQALGWHNEMNFYAILAVVSLGLGIVPWMLARRKYKNSRNKPMTCPACKGKMHKLNEEEDNALLSPSQDFEEKLDTVDYDVWVCDTCGTVERYPFRKAQMKYEECPVCHTVAMTMVRDHTILPATTRREGIGEKIYECKYCHHSDNRRYKIPRKEDGTAAALAAGAILGASRGGSGFGGGMGGGFGGGRTGGGGATGRW